MALNFPGPYQLRWTSDYDGIVHDQALNLILDADPSIGTPFTGINVVMRNSVSKALATVEAEFFALLQPLYDPAQTLTDIQLWKYEPLSFDASYVAGSSNSYSGTSVGTVTAAFYCQYSFRSQEGGIAYFKMLENRVTSNARRSYAALGASEQAVVDYMSADTTPFVARDTSYFAIFSRSNGGTDERSWRKRYRA